MTVFLAFMLCIFVPAMLMVFIVSSSEPILKSERLFHKRKIVECTHADGTVDYTVKVNGFLGLPLLYQTDEYDYGLCILRCKGMSFKQANEYIELRENDYNKKIGYKTIRKRTIN